LPRRRRWPGRWILVLGDAASLAVITAFGFAIHQEFEAVRSSRFLATYLSFLAAWLVTAAGLGALDPDRADDPRQLWRPAVAVLVATPIAAVLRSAWLGTPPVAVFILVMAAVSLVSLGLWRTAHLLVRRRREAKHRVRGFKHPESPR
jgi:asparagine N-glycosylation enzyme membrane subunit Stt3